MHISRSHLDNRDHHGRSPPALAQKEILNLPLLILLIPSTAATAENAQQLPSLELHLIGSEWKQTLSLRYNKSKISYHHNLLDKQPEDEQVKTLKRA